MSPNDTHQSSHVAPPTWTLRESRHETPAYSKLDANKWTFISLTNVKPLGSIQSCSCRRSDMATLQLYFTSIHMLSE